MRAPGRPSRYPWASVADGTVYAFAEKVGVPVVAGILLDHMHHDPAERDLIPITRVLADVVERAGGAGDGACAVACFAPRGECLLGVGVVDIVEVAVRIGLG